MGPPPPPKAANGATVHTLAGGVPTPTSFAFGRGTVFVGGFGVENEDGSLKSPGGVYKIAGGKATRISGTKGAVFGVVWARKKLYVTSGKKLLAFGGWNGTKFASRKVVWTGPKGFPGLDGLAYSRGRIYAGVSLNFKFDHKTDHAPYAQSVISVKTNGTGVRTVAKGIRQPFQLTFVKGHRYPYVSNLGHDEPASAKPLDYIAVARPGQNYGFAKCTWEKASACKGYARPKKFLPPHSSPMGIGAIGQRLYFALFGGIGKSGPEVVSMPARGGKVKPLLTGFVAPVVAVGTHCGSVYAGDLTGSVYRVKP